MQHRVRMATGIRPDPLCIFDDRLSAGEPESGAVPCRLPVWKMAFFFLLLSHTSQYFSLCT
jgi:hypothetical protein